MVINGSAPMVPVMDVANKELKNFIKKRDELIEKYLKIFDGDFYLQYVLQILSTEENRPRYAIAVRQSCPTPNYDETVYRYNRETNQPELLWVIPDKKTCFQLKEHFLEVAPEERELLQYVLDFDAGELLKLCKKLNGEHMKPGVKLEKG